MAYRPWRAKEAESLLTGKVLNEANAAAAAEVALHGAKTHGNNDYKPVLGRKTIIRALLHAQSLSRREGVNHAG
jgi:xanthine dehydrogenase YagS FAD-binding subunit